MGLIALSASAALFGLVWARPAIWRAKPLPPRLALHPTEILADGYDAATLRIEAPLARAGAPLRVSVLENIHGATVQELTADERGWTAQLRAGVVPGRMIVRVEASGLPPAVIGLTSRLDPRDTAGDGTPDILRLDDAQDQQAFRRWFTFLAEAQYFQPADARPAEIDDCAGLIRYAYREALRRHDSRWAAEVQLPVVPAFESVAKYQYPFTPLGAALFRVTPGRFRPSDLARGAFAQFADARTLLRLNTYFLSRDLPRALPGDLLFFRQESEHMPFHSMIYVGESPVGADGTRYVVYHTGPDGAAPGEIRRLSLDQLLRFPEPQWRPAVDNSAFLGVYRWNILRTSS